MNDSDRYFRSYLYICMRHILCLPSLVLHYSSTSLRVWLEQLPGKAQPAWIMNIQLQAGQQDRSIINVFKSFYKIHKIFWTYFVSETPWSYYSYIWNLFSFHTFVFPIFLPPIKGVAKLQIGDLWTEIPMSWMSTHLILLTCHIRYQLTH